MKQKKLYLSLTVAFIALLIGALFAYRYLSSRYEASQMPARTEEDIKAIDFTVYDADGNPVTLFDQVGKPIVLNFWATWCGPCKSELPAFDKLSKEYEDKVTFMMINVTDGRKETVQGVKAFLEENNYTFPVYFDTTLQAANIYGAYSIPLTVLISSDGYLEGYQVGAVSENALRSALEPLK